MPLCVLLVFLVLAAQYESLRLPLAIVLVVPLCLLFTLIGVQVDGGDHSVFTQIGSRLPGSIRRVIEPKEPEMQVTRQ